MKSYKSGVCLDLRQTPETELAEPLGFDRTTGLEVSDIEEIQLFTQGSVLTRFLQISFHMVSCKWCGPSRVHSTLQ